MKERDEAVASSIISLRATLRQQAVLWHLLAVGLVLLAWALRLHRLDAQSLWYDEAYAVYISQRAPAEALLWSSRDLVPPFHPYLLTLWLPLSGPTEFSARFLSTWMGALSVAASVALGRNLHSRRAGLLTGMLVALSPFYVWHSQDARMYMSQATLGLLATLLLVRALRSPERWGQWIGLALLDALTLYTQATGGFLVAYHAVVILVSGLGKAGRTRLTRGGLALLSALLVWLPWLLYALPLLEENAGYWSGRLNWQFIASGAFRGFVSGEMMEGMGESVALGVWGAAGLVGLVILFLSSDDSDFITGQTIVVDGGSAMH